MDTRNYWVLVRREWHLAEAPKPDGTTLLCCAATIGSPDAFFGGTLSKLPGCHFGERLCLRARELHDLRIQEERTQRTLLERLENRRQRLDLAPAGPTSTEFAGAPGFRRQRPPAGEE